MASPPFIISIIVPGDTDTVSQFPGVDRANLDKINSWLSVEHSTYGNHPFITMPQIGSAAIGASGSAPTPASSISAIYRDTDKAMRLKNTEDGSEVQFLQVPPGVFFPYAGATLPTGYLWCNGAAVSRTTYARLFTAIGVGYGAGDTTTTFNVPDLLERVPVGRGTMGGVADPARITNAVSGFDPTALAANNTLGVQAITLVQSDLPNINQAVVVVITDPGHVHTSSVPGSFLAQGGGTGTNAGALSNSTTSAFTGITASGTCRINGNQAQTAQRTLPPMIVTNYIIKY